MLLCSVLMFHVTKVGCFNVLEVVWDEGGGGSGLLWYHIGWG